MRQVRSNRFLIGAGAQCDLRLGGEEIPPLHSLVLLQDNEAWLEVMASAPAVLVNGRHETSIQLHDSDRVAIGPFELIVHFTTPCLADGPVLDSASPVGENSDEVPVGELSAAELVERIQAAAELVEDFEERQRLGMATLMNAIQQRVRESQPDHAEAAPDAVLPIGDVSGRIDGAILGDLQALVDQLSAVVAEMEKRSVLHWRREAEYADAVSTLFEAQDRLAGQLEFLMRRIASLNLHTPGREPGRAIA